MSLLPELKVTWNENTAEYALGEVGGYDEEEFKALVYARSREELRLVIREMMQQLRKLYTETHSLISEEELQRRHDFIVAERERKRKEYEDKAKEREEARFAQFYGGQITQFFPKARMEDIEP